MLPNILVQLAALGTSGVCILIIFWVGITLRKLPKDTPRAQYRLLSYYLLLCLFIAIISALTGVALAAYRDEERQSTLQTLESNKKAFEEIQKDVQRLKDSIAKPPTEDPVKRAEAAKTVEKAAKETSTTAAKAADDTANAIQKAQRDVGKSVKRVFGW